MDGDHSRNADPQFITFHDFSPINQAGNTEGQLDTGVVPHVATHQPFNNLSNDSTGIGIIEDLQGIHNKNEGS